MIRDWADDEESRRLRGMPAVLVRRHDGHVVTLAAGASLPEDWHVVHADGTPDEEATRARVVAERGTSAFHCHEVTRRDLVAGKEAFTLEMMDRFGPNHEHSIRNPIGEFFVSGQFLKQGR